MYCEKCGTPYENVNAPCPSCGNVFEQETEVLQDLDATMRAPVQTQVQTQIQPEAPLPPPMPVAPPVQAPVQEPKNKKEEKSGKKWIGKVIALAVVAVIIVAGAIVGSTFMVNRAMIGGGLEEKIQLGDKYLDDMDYEEALITYESALEINPDSYEARYGYAKANECLKKYDEAKESYALAIDLNPAAPEPHIALAEIYIQEGEPELAKKQVQAAIKNGINDETINSMNTAMNPKKPTANVDPANLVGRGPIVLTDKDGGTVHYTTDGTVPTVDSPIFKDELILPSGETLIKAITVSRYDFISDVAEYRYVTKTQNLPVTFTDPILNNYVRDALGLYYGSQIMTDDLAKIRNISFIGNEGTANEGAFTFTESEYYESGSYYGRNYMGSLVSVAELAQYCPYLKEINIAFQTQFDPASLAGFKNLENLSLINVNLTNVNAFAGMTKLKKLCLGWNNINNINGLSALVNLTHLGVWGNAISDISVVKNMPNLEYLDISDNAVSNISIISGLANLKEFWAYGNRISNFAALKGLMKLEVLMISNNPIADTNQIKAIYSRLSQTDIAIN